MLVQPVPGDQDGLHSGFCTSRAGRGVWGSPSDKNPGAHVAAPSRWPEGLLLSHPDVIPALRQPSVPQHFFPKKSRPGCSQSLQGRHSLSRPRAAVFLSLAVVRQTRCGYLRAETGGKDEMVRGVLDVLKSSLQEERNSPGRCGCMGWAPSRRGKVTRRSLGRAQAGSWVGSLGRACTEDNQLMFLSHIDVPLPPSLLSLKSRIRKEKHKILCSKSPQI